MEEGVRGQGNWSGIEEESRTRGRREGISGYRIMGFLINFSEVLV